MSVPRSITFDPEFDPAKIEPIAPMLGPTYEAMERLAGKSVTWPGHIGSMSAAEIAEWRARGKGHGLYYPDRAEIKINPHMTSRRIYLNFIHESLHHALPDATDEEINRVLVPRIYREVTGRTLRGWP